MYYLSNVYLLDLCILSYHLHAQTLICPLDPYYEFSKADARRDAIMDALRAVYDGQPDVHGPARCQGTGAEGWQANDTLEPIFSDYKRIYPWRPSFTRPDGKREPWIIYNTPPEITGRIGKVYMARYGQKAGPYLNPPVEKIEVDPIHAANPSATTAQPAADLLYCFEGGTGAIYEDGGQKQYAAWSMMGFVLAREPEDEESSSEYDVFIVFRGSRSGQLRLAQAGWKEKGNPDWVTDLQIKDTAVKIPEISQPGKCVQGFAASLKTMLPTVMRCLQEVHKAKQKKPRCIYVTGHSLGGALASLFAGAVLLGNRYGIEATGSIMPKELRKKWGFPTMRLVTFSSPAVGNPKFRRSLDAVCPGSRIFVNGDIVTKELPFWAKAVGISSDLEYKKRKELLSNEEAFHTKGTLDPHEPLAVRRLLCADLDEDSVESAYIPMNRINDEPWKLCKSGKGVLETLASGRKPIELAALIPNCEEFLLLLLENLSDSYSRRQGNDIRTILNEIRRINRDKTQYPDELKKLQSLRVTWKQNCPDLREKESLYNLIGLCLFFNAVSKDPKIYTDSAKFNKVKSLIGEEE